MLNYTSTLSPWRTGVFLPALKLRCAGSAGSVLKARKQRESGKKRFGEVTLRAPEDRPPEFLRVLGRSPDPP